MKKLRIVLLPFSWIYGLIITSRNFLFDRGILKSYVIPQKSICIGNLSVGGTGKSPHVDVIADHFINKGIVVATLSRGYGRTTSGVLEVNEMATASEVGDEPLMYKLRHREKLHVVVAESRKLGVEYIQSAYTNNKLIILDDAFQHRTVKAGLNVLISDYNHLFINDHLIPAGNLREGKKGIKRADILIISKCPVYLSPDEKKNLFNQISFDPERIFFSRILYDNLKTFNSADAAVPENILLVTGIANPTPLFEYLSSIGKVEHLKFKDHHHFTAHDIRQIHEKFDTFATRNKAIITTEKDFMRLKSMQSVKEHVDSWFYQPITTKIDDEQKFNLLLDEYVIEI